MCSHMESLNLGMESLKLGSKPPCSNVSDATPCKNSGSLACKDCLMVTYCSKRCQVTHWPTHREDCKSSFRKETWKPRWIAQNRAPAFMGNDSVHVSFGTPKYLWGNVPAFDVVQLCQNEGVESRKPIHILFAASGDMRNAILSVASLPPRYRGPLDIVINDLEIDVVARNVIFLLILFVEKDPAVAAEYVLHVWYSALITELCSRMLFDKLRPLVEEVCNKIAQKPGPARFGKTWKFGESSLRLILTRDNWYSLLSYFDVPQGLTKDTAQRVRQRTVSTPERVDYLDRKLCHKSPSEQLGMTKFRKDGILLPFGHPREDFTIPNPTLFHSPQTWPMMDNADPIAGWPLKSFMELDIGPAKNDVYGKLYYYLKHLLADFHGRMRSLPTTFELLHMDARFLPESLAGRHFDRIDVGNICDMAYLGIDGTLTTFSALLQPPSVNPCATLITLFLNAVAEMKMLTHSVFGPAVATLMEDPGQQMNKVLEYMPELRRPIWHPYDPTLIRLISALELVYDVDSYFNRYMNVHDFAGAALRTRLEMKADNTIIDAWPMKVSGSTPTSKTRHDFAVLLSSDHTGQERYAEWQLKAEANIEDVD